MPPPTISPIDGPSDSFLASSKRKSTGAAASDHKRAKLTDPFDREAARMSKVLGTQSRPAFQPNHGAKKLIIRNLRTASRAAELEKYYDNSRKELVDALHTIFKQKPPRQPLEKLYRGVEDICRHGEGDDLHDMLRRECQSYLTGPVYKSVTEECASSKINALKCLLKYWGIWNGQLRTIRSIFSFLDRSYLLGSRGLEQINDMGITLFRGMAYKPPTVSNSSAVMRSIGGILELIEYDRRGDSRFDATLLRDSISMLHIINSYNDSFEGRFLKSSSAYFKDFAEEQSTASLKSYIAACETLLSREDHRCNTYNFDSTTKRQLLNEAHSTLIDNYSEKLLDSGSIGRIIDENAVDPMKALYDLLRLSNLQQRLKGPWEEYIKGAGSEIVNDTVRGDEMVVRLLEFRRALDVMVRDAFNKNDEFHHGLRQAFDSFINDKKVLSSWKTGTSKVGEMIAKYIDMLLRGGLKTLPKSLMSDVKDRVDAEKSGQASTGDEDAELDRQLDQALELFRFIEGKDVFEAFYKQDLARRLLMGRSASADAERSMLAKLKSECGSNFTHNLEQMFKDQQIGRDEMASYKAWREGTGRDKSSLDLAVNILSAAAWPTYPDTQITLPDEVASQLEQFDAYYVNKYTGRRLTWKHSLAHCVVKARFNKAPKELLVSAYQAVVLTLFNQVDDQPDGFLAYQQIAECSGLSGPDLDRTLQSLACGKVRVLTKHPKGRDVKPTDTFTVNKAFADPKYRVKINQIQLKETKEENQETHKKVAQDRQFETQAAIVRIMKSRKTLTHANLVAEVINQTKKRGAVDTSEIKKNIEKLIEKEYLERDGNSYSYLA
ncbi:Uu.00g003580.m01.CDS01 [Anthostomella pinea]|uniref:Uu.00g003580.m01.CDS01 n=1 Tax=Anthostomella pinea TaxID=933095 RepID=A0AAI8YIV1_9PEZI|nr:Uu.00g003580.m01.CDS01 [Anthostomella pinea]